jgi:hypothetical protein
LLLCGCLLLLFLLLSLLSCFLVCICICGTASGCLLVGRLTAAEAAPCRRRRHLSGTSRSGGGSGILRSRHRRR